MTPTTIILDDGTAIPLVRDETGLSARHDGWLIHVTAVRSSKSVTPAKWIQR